MGDVPGIEMSLLAFQTTPDNSKIIESYTQKMI